MTVFTIGYEGLDLEAFLSLLAEHEVMTVIDVRELPLSRKPGFSKKALSSALIRSDLGYVHLPKLGCPKPIRDRYREDGDWQDYTERFLAHLEAQKTAVAELSEMVNSSSCALLCYEADFNFCHRSLVASAVREQCGARIEHITNEGTRTTRAASRRPAYA
jgi:uncharacterized protein (DUF488 family)